MVVLEPFNHFFHVLMYRVFPCLMSYILWWAAYIDVGFQFNNFMESFENDRQTLEDFLHESMSFWRRETQYHWSDVEDCIKVDKTPIDVNARKMYQLTDDGVTGHQARKHAIHQEVCSVTS